MTDRESDRGGDAPVSVEGTPVQASWPDLPCFGCGPANEEGLHLESYRRPDDPALEVTVEPPQRFRVMPGMVYGGYLASVIDCNSMWTAMTYASPAEARPPESRPAHAYATAQLNVEYHEPTPMGVALDVTSRVAGDIGRSVEVETEVVANGTVTVTGDVTAVRMDGVL